MIFCHTSNTGRDFELLISSDDLLLFTNSSILTQVTLAYNVTTDKTNCPRHYLLGRAEFINRYLRRHKWGIPRRSIFIWPPVIDKTSCQLWLVERVWNFGQEIRGGIFCITETYGKNQTEITVAWTRLKQDNSWAEKSDGRDLGIPKSNLFFGWTRRKVQRKMLDQYSCRVLSKWPETTTGKTSTTMEGWNFQGILVIIKKRTKARRRWNGFMANSVQ